MTEEQARRMINLLQQILEAVEENTQEIKELGSILGR